MTIGSPSARGFGLGEPGEIVLDWCDVLAERFDCIHFCCEAIAFGTYSYEWTDVARCLAGQVRGGDVGDHASIEPRGGRWGWPRRSIGVMSGR